MMKTTPLNAVHREAGARMVDFGVVRPLPGKSSVLVKSYPSSSPIFGSPTGGVTLTVRFMVSTTGVSVDGMWLTLTPIRS